MGRKTWESLPEKYRPLPGRFNIILTRSTESRLPWGENAMTCRSMGEALAVAEALVNYDEAVLIGGERVYTEGLKHCDTLYLTEVEGIFQGDTKFPAFDHKEWFVRDRKGYPANKERPLAYTFSILERY
jgi:dihydrofolate reductase